MKKRIWIVFLLVLALCGCGDDRYEKVSFDNAATLPIEEVEEMPEFELNIESNSTYTEGGVFFVVFEEDSTQRILCFADSTTDEVYPLCARPNCSHDTDECPARMEVSNLHYDGEYLYFVYGSAFTGQSIMRQRPDGSDREVLFQQEAEDNGIASIHETLYSGDTLYFTTVGSVFDPETGEITTGEHVCIGDLKSGEMQVIPINFGEGDGTSTGILGVYGNELLLGHTSGGEGIFGEQTYRSRLFLLNMDTYEITLIAESTLQDRQMWELIGDSLLYFELDWSDGELLMDHETEGELKKITCDIMVVDLKTRKAYLKRDVTRTTRTLCNELCVYYEWNEDYTAFTKMVMDLKTGEIRPYPEGMPRLTGLTRGGKHLYAKMQDDQGQWLWVRILEEDFWAGKPDFYVFPEWTKNRWY